MKKIYFIIILILILFLWFEVRPSIIRSKCQAQHDVTFQELKKINSEFHVKTGLSSEEFQKVQKILKDKKIRSTLVEQLDAQLGITSGYAENVMGNVSETSAAPIRSPAANKTLTKLRVKFGIEEPKNTDFFTYSITSKGWERVPEEYKNDFEIMPISTEQRNVFREVAEKEYQGCLRSWGITK